MIRDLTAQEVIRFWQNVDRRGPRECWPWVRAWPRIGPMFYLDGRAVSALQIMYNLHHDEPVPDGCSMLRKCGAKRNGCINPAHLVVVPRGTRYTFWWPRQIKEGRGNVRHLAALAGFDLEPAESGRYRVVRPALDSTTYSET